MEGVWIPGWAGPPVGAAVGAGAGLYYGAQQKVPLSPAWLLFFALVGTAAGFAVWVGDVLRRRQARYRAQTPAQRTRTADAEAFRAAYGLWLFIALLSTICLGALGVDRVRETHRMARWPTVRGTVVESHVRTRVFHALDVPEESYSPAVRYRYRVDGTEWEGRAVNRSAVDVSFGRRDQAAAVVDRYTVGATPLVHFDPDDPARCILEPGLTWDDGLRFVGAPLLMLGTAGLAAGALWAGRAAPA